MANPAYQMRPLGQPSLGIADDSYLRSVLALSHPSSLISTLSLILPLAPSRFYVLHY